MNERKFEIGDHVLVVANGDTVFVVYKIERDIHGNGLVYFVKTRDSDRITEKNGYGYHAENLRLLINKPKFKIGDWVILADSSGCFGGTRACITAIRTDITPHKYHLRDADPTIGDMGWWPAKSFSLAPKFKVGDRVDTNAFGQGHITAIREGKGWTHIVSFDNGQFGDCHPEDLTLLPPSPSPWIPQVGDVIRRNTWKETTTATITQVSGNTPLFKFRMTEGNKYNCRWHAAEAGFTLVRRPEKKLFLDEITEAPTNDSCTTPRDYIPFTKFEADRASAENPFIDEFKPGDEVYILCSHPKYPGCYGTIKSKLEDGKHWVEVLNESGQPIKQLIRIDPVLMRPRHGESKSDQYFRNAFRDLRNITLCKTPIEEFFGYPKDTAMRPINIENKTFVNGQDVSKLDDQTIILLIKESEDQIKTLGELQHKPKRIQKLIADLEEGVTKLVAVLDERDETKH